MGYRFVTNRFATNLSIFISFQHPQIHIASTICMLCVAHLVFVMKYLPQNFKCSIIISLYRDWILSAILSNHITTVLDQQTISQCFLRRNYNYMKFITHAHAKTTQPMICLSLQDDVIKWKHFRCCWSFVRGIHRSPVNSPHRTHWRGALMLSLTCPWTNGRINNRDVSELRRHHAHYDVTVIDNFTMPSSISSGPRASHCC